MPWFLFINIKNYCNFELATVKAVPTFVPSKVTVPSLDKIAFKVAFIWDIWATKGAMLIPPEGEAPPSLLFDKAFAAPGAATRSSFLDSSNNPPSLVET